MRFPAVSGRAAAALLVAILVAGCAQASPAPATSGAPSASLSPSGGAAGGSGAPAGGSSAPAGGSGGASADAVTIQGFAFGPSSLSISVGTTVTWTNQDSTQHTVTADDGSFGSQPLPTGQTFSQTFAKAGTFAYHCRIHPSMTATVVVH